MPGDNVEMTIELIHPIAMEQGLTSLFLGKPHKRTSKMLRISSVAGIRQMPAKSIKQGRSAAWRSEN